MEVKIILTNSTSTALNSSDIAEVSWKNPGKFLFLPLAELSMREMKNIFVRFSRKRVAFTRYLL